MTISASQYNTLLLTTRDNIVTPKAVDQIAKTMPALELYRAALTNKTGESLRAILAYARSGNTQLATSDSGAYTEAISGEIRKAAVYEWPRPIISHWQIPWLDQQKNSGPEEIEDLLTAHMESAMEEHAEVLDTYLHAATTAANSPTSLYDLVNPLVTFGQIRGGVATTTVTNKALTSNVATLTFAVHTYLVGDSVVVADVDATFNGTFTITAVDRSVAGAQTISYAKTASNVSSTASGGTATVAACNDWWNPTYLVLDSDAYDIFEAFQYFLNTVVVNRGKVPTDVLCGFDVYSAVQNYVASNSTNQDIGGDRIVVGFREIYILGLRIVFDPSLGADEAMFIHRPTLVAGYLNGNFMKVQEPRQVIGLGGNLDYDHPMASVIQLGTSHRRSNGLLVWNSAGLNA